LPGNEVCSVPHAPPIRIDDTYACQGEEAMRTRIAASVVVVLLIVALAAADKDRGDIAGTVTDRSGARLAGVTVTITGPESRTTSTNSRGEFAFEKLRPGEYDVRYGLSGFVPVVKRVMVRASQTTQAPVSLRVGALEQTITTTGESPRMDAQVERRSEGGARDNVGTGSGLGRGTGTGVGPGMSGGTGGGLHGVPPPPVAAPVAPAPYWPGRKGGPFDTEAYDFVHENTFRRVSTDPLSTFSIDVDTASYANVRRFLKQRTLPPAGAVRIEELVNYFRYDYPQPSDQAPFSVTTEVAQSPWNQKYRLALIGLQGREMRRREVAPRNLVFLIDVSGSMAPHDKLPLVRRALQMLVANLTGQDRVAIVVYAGASGLVLPSTPSSRKAEINRAIAELEAGGSTNGGAGIRLAYRIAEESFIPGGVNRVILATDGDFNVGVTSQDELVRLIEQRRESGIFLSVLGVGTGNLKDSTMEKLADKGNGNYAYLDSVHEAHKVLVREVGGTLVTIAKDVKIQVEFNPAAVAAYRLVGYENRLLRHDEFNDDRRDAGEIGSGHSVTALYEVVPRGVDVEAPLVDPLKYQRPAPQTRSASSSELATIKLRYKAPDGDVSRLISVVLPNRTRPMTAQLGFASAVAEFGMLLRRSDQVGDASYRALAARAQRFRGADPDGYRAEFIELVGLARQLEDGELDDDGERRY
jgi:Ca-activated chloride channel family protein